VSKVRMGNGDLIVVEGKDTTAIESCAGTKLIHDVFCIYLSSKLVKCW